MNNSNLSHLQKIGDNSKPLPSHIAFADETHHTNGRYRGVAIISLPYPIFSSAQSDLNAILKESDVREFKWKRLSSARMRFAALKMLDWVIEKARINQLRADVLIWDTEDSRHRIKHRDDMANMQRMYYQLFKNVLGSRWPDDATWWLFPDEQTAINWPEIANFLDQASSVITITNDLLNRSPFYLDIKNKFHLHKLQTVQSHEEPLVQLADLFAGLGVYSRTTYTAYQQWVEDNLPQKTLFAQLPKSKLSTSDKERCQVLNTFNHTCKKHKLGVSLKSSSGLRTMNPTNPLNFWWYIPQHEEDKAPTKHNTYTKEEQ